MSPLCKEKNKTWGRRDLGTHPLLCKAWAENQLNKKIKLGAAGI